MKSQIPFQNQSYKDWKALFNQNWIALDLPRSGRVQNCFRNWNPGENCHAPMLGIFLKNSISLIQQRNLVLLLMAVMNYPNKTLIHFKREIRGRKSVKLFVMQMIENLMNWKKPGVWLLVLKVKKRSLLATTQMKLMLELVQGRICMNQVYGKRTWLVWIKIFFHLEAHQLGTVSQVQGTLTR